MNISRPGPPTPSRRRTEGAASLSRTRRTNETYGDDEPNIRPLRRPQILQSTSSNSTTSTGTIRETILSQSAARTPRVRRPHPLNQIRAAPSTSSETSSPLQTRVEAFLRPPETLSPPETVSRFQPEEARAQIINLEQQLERLHQRLLQNRLLNSSVNQPSVIGRRRRETENMQPSAMPRTLVGTNPFERQPNPGPSTRPHLSSEGASGSSHNSPFVGAEERLRALQQLDFSSDSDSSSSRRIALLEEARNLESSLANAAAIRRRRNGGTRTTGSLTLQEDVHRGPRQLWRLQDSARYTREMDSELESLHDTARSRHNITEFTASAINPDHLSIRENESERLRQAWGDIESDDHVSPLTSLFHTSWSEHRRQPEGVRIEQEATQNDSGVDSILDFENSARGIYLSQYDSSQLSRARFLSAVLDNSPSSSRRADLRARAASSAQTNLEPEIYPKLDDHKDRPPPLEPEDLKIDCECKICFSQIADTLLLPCAHLVLCEWCADQIGAKTKDFVTLRRPNCPICRKMVLDRMKVFRG